MPRNVDARKTPRFILLASVCVVVAALYFAQDVLIPVALAMLLSFLMTPENHQRKSREWKGVTREFYAMPFENRYIWGVTAGILRNLYERICGA